VSPLLHHRFGVNYTPSQNWYFCFNDWNAGDVARDLATLASLGADHIRVMVVWPWFQPNPRHISPAHLDRLDTLMIVAAAEGLDVMPCVYTGWLSGYRFQPPFLQDQPFYTAPDWAAAQTLLLDALAERMGEHPNFLGFDIGNEINCCWQTTPDQGDAWMARVFAQMQAAHPGCVHVNGVDHKPWFQPHTFSPQALVAEQPIVALHCWPFWTGAGDRGGPLDRPYTHLGAAMATLARSLGNAPQKPVWIQEFGVCATEMPEPDIPRWTESFVTTAIDAGVSWFTWWASHDVPRRFDFHPFEYGLGLIDSDNRIKPQGRLFRDLATAWRGKPVRLPGAVPSPPTLRSPAATWDWMTDWIASI
jgi:hypothetical protein